MPLLIGTFTAPPSDDVPVYVEDVGTIRATWIDPTGVEWPLSDIDPDTGAFTTWDISGWGARPYEYTTDPLTRGGEDVRFIRAKPARFTWPLHIYGDTHMEFTQRYRDLRRAFMMTAWQNLPGTLRVSRPDGTARQIQCWCEDGWGLEKGQGWLSATPVLTLFAPDGYWTDVTPITVSRASATGVDFLSGFPAVSSSQVLGATTIVNPGDVRAWPSWVITGPATAITATNTTTNETFTLTTTLTAGQQATIDTLKAQVRGPTGTNLVGSLNWPTAYLWSLLAGSNSITFTVAGSGTGTRIDLTFYPRYEGA